MTEKEREIIKNKLKQHFLLNLGGVSMKDSMKEKEFHNKRRAFAIFDDKLNWCPKGLSHYEWLVDSGLFKEFQFEDLVRGYVDETGIYFYIGDFKTNQYLEDIAKSWMNSIDKDLPVYCGVYKGKVGERWKPIKLIRGKRELHVWLGKPSDVVVFDDYNSTETVVSGLSSIIHTTQIEFLDGRYAEYFRIIAHDNDRDDGFEVPKEICMREGDNLSKKWLSGDLRKEISHVQA